jgi:GNAT superfamily N-acetyltransferase
MDRNIAFLRVRTDEAIRLRQLAVEIYAQHYTDLWDDGGRSYMAEAFSLNQLTCELEDSSVRYYYVTDTDDPVGFVKVVLPANDDQGAGLYLERLYLDSKATGRGLGWKCLAFAESEALRCGYNRIWLNAMAYRDDVCRFYKKHGFSECGIRTLTVSDIVPGREAMVIFEKILPA